MDEMKNFSLEEELHSNRKTKRNHGRRMLGILFMLISFLLFAAGVFVIIDDDLIRPQEEQPVTEEAILITENMEPIEESVAIPEKPENIELSLDPSCISGIYQLQGVIYLSGNKTFEDGSQQAELNVELEVSQFDSETLTLRYNNGTGTNYYATAAYDQEAGTASYFFLNGASCTLNFTIEDGNIRATMHSAQATDDWSVRYSITGLKTWE